MLQYLGGGCVLLLVGVLLGAYLCLRGSLPTLEGRMGVAGLSAPVTITRDARGVPTIEAHNRADLAWATGFLHAQDRFFEMDLSRRLAAGELSGLVGRLALEQDRKARLFRFRSIAREVVAQADAQQRAVLEAYTRGVNAGLARAALAPLGILAARAPPTRAGSTEDSILVTYAMWWDLQSEDLRRDDRLRLEVTRASAARPAAGWKCALEFLYPARTDWDAPASARSPRSCPAPVPPPEALDLRSARRRAPPGTAAAAAAPRCRQQQLGGLRRD